MPHAPHHPASYFSHFLHLNLIGHWPLVIGHSVLVVLAPCSLLLTSCSKPAAPSNNATLPVPAFSLNLAAGRSLTPGTVSEIIPEFVLSDPDVVPSPLIFGSGRYAPSDLREPIILRRSGNAWTFVELPTLNHTDWVYAGASFERGELWAILDSTPQSAGAGLYLFRSTDHGQTWSVFSGVKPPTLSAEFVEFTMTVRGLGHITVHQDDDIESTPRGLYVYNTADGGKTWSGPTFTRDDLVSSDAPSYPTLKETIQSLDLDATGPATPPASVPPTNRSTASRGRGG